MASSSVCTSCLRTLRNQARSELRRQPSQHLRFRLLSMTSTKLAEQQQRFGKPPQPNGVPANFANTIANNLRTNAAFRSTTEPYVAYGGTEDLFRACSAQCTYTIPNANKTPAEPAPKNAAEEDVGEGQGWWVESKSRGGLGLDVTFNTWAQVLFLHMYILTVRLRMFPKEHAGVWHQNLLDHFFYAAEDRMATWHGMSARGVRNKHLKDLWLQWRGLLLSYDEGLIKGDAVLATAIWRNLFKANEEVDVQDVATVTAYMRRALQRLGELSDQELSEGRVLFGNPASIVGIVGRESPWMHKSFTAEDLKAIEQKTA